MNVITGHTSASCPRLQHPTDPLTYEEAHDGNAEADDEHIEPRTENAAASKHRACRADQKVGEHRKHERDHDGRGTGPDQKGEHRDECTNGCCRAGDPSLAKRRHMWLTDSELLLYLLLEHALRVAHHFRRERMRTVRIHSL